ncbi:MAG: response regulator [Patescibacteria group bacterium]|nr:response regulator [Patescibacteria group bacterium]
MDTMIIIVDDEKSVREITARMLSKLSEELAVSTDDIPEVISFEKSDEAWEFISHLPEEPNIVFSSVDKDGAGNMNGLDLLTVTKEKFPDVILVSMSGDPGYEEEAMERGADYFLAKPFLQEDLKKIFA